MGRRGGSSPERGASVGCQQRRLGSAFRGTLTRELGKYLVYTAEEGHGVFLNTLSTNKVSLLSGKTLTFLHIWDSVSLVTSPLPLSPTPDSARPRPPSSHSPAQDVRPWLLPGLLPGRQWPTLSTAHTPPQETTSLLFLARLLDFGGLPSRQHCMHSCRRERTMEGESPGPAPVTKGPAAQLLQSQVQLAHQRPPRSLCHSCSYRGYPAESAPPGGSRPSTPGVPPLHSGVTLRLPGTQHPPRAPR